MITQENEGLKKRLSDGGEVSRKVGEYESRLLSLNQEIERLNGVLRIKVDENSNYEGKIKGLNIDNDGLRRQVSEFEYRLTQQTQEWQTRISSYESRLKQYTAENDELRRKLQEQSDAWRAESDEYRRKMNELGDSRMGKLSEYENKIALLSQEIERLNSILRSATEDIEEFKRRDGKYLAEIERLNNTLRLKVEESSRFESSRAELIAQLRAFEQDNKALRNSNEMLSKEYENSKKHLLEYEER